MIFIHCYPLTVFTTVALLIVEAPGNLTVIESQDASFSCLVTGSPRPQILWVRLADMAHLQSQSGLTIDEQEFGDKERRSNLTIIGVQLSDAGVYVCVATNKVRSIMAHVTLTVHGEWATSLIVNKCVVIESLCFL